MTENIFELASQTSIDQSNTYIITYPYIVDYFAGCNPLTAKDLLCGALMVYGWMPTTLKSITSGKSLVELTAMLNDVRRRGSITDDELGRVTGLTNNSLVGASKLLHFLAPDQFAIWDSKVYAFIHGRHPHPYQVQSTAKYREYLSTLEELCSRAEFPAFHESINSKIGYPVSPFRASEIVMFHRAPPKGAGSSA